MTRPLQIRIMTQADLDAVTALAARSPAASNWPAHVYADFLNQRQTIALVAATDRAVEAFAIARTILDTTQLEAIIVEEELRRQGIGASLLEAIIDHARDHSATRIELEVRAGNQPAIALYQRAGFTRDGRRRNYYQHPPEDALLMSLTLSLNLVHTPLLPENTP